MHRYLSRVRDRRRSEQGLVAIIIALSMTALVMTAAVILDFGLVRVDRQVNKSAADAAATAGLYALNGGNEEAHPFSGVCTAIRYLRRNDVRFDDVTSTSGTWTDGNGNGTGNGCSSTALQAQRCTPGNQTTWARYTWDGTYQGQALKVVVQSGYQLAGSDFPEENLPAALAQNDDGAQGCSQLAVIITQNRRPGFGSLARSADLTTTIRTVGRVKTSASGDAPALLLLKRTGCPVLSTGSNGGGSYIRVYGAVSADGLSQPGSVHADSDGQGCGGSLFEGKASNGIVAFAAPLISNPAVADPNKPGQITSVAGKNGVSIGTVRDGGTNVYASAAINETAAGSAAKIEPSGRMLVTRKLVDDRYLGLGTSTGVKGVVTAAQNNVFGAITSGATATANGYMVINSCSASAADLASVTATDKVYLNCTSNSGYTGTAPINAGTVVFAGSVKPPNSSAGVSLPNAHHVYIFGDPTKDAISLSTGGKFSVHTAGNVTPTDTCSTVESSSKAVVVIKAGQIKQNGGLLQLCKTTLITMGGQANGCLPTTSGTAPTQSPCISGMGDSQLSQTGGDVDWTAPNQYNVITLPNGDPDPSRAPAWTDVNGLEDLAFWSESAGSATSSTYSVNGSGTLRTVGVYMVPNADNFTIGGGGSQDLTNAQYITASIALNGNTTRITMRVDANAAVALDRLRNVGLVR